MRYGAIQNVGARISRLILGTLIFSADQPEAGFELLDAFVAAGGTAIDTAHSYAGGDSERGVGAWLRRSGRPADFTIITKGAHPRLPDEPRRVTPAAIAADLAESLDRLGVETIDLYLLHRDDEEIPVEIIIDCLNEHQAQGRIRAFGGSNWSHQRIQAANDYAARRGLAGFVASSPNLALAVPSEPIWPGCLTIAGDDAALAWYQERQMPALAWSSGARGFFSGRFTPESVELDPAVTRSYYRPDNWERLERARQIASSQGCTPTQVALAWVLRQPFPTFALIGPRSMSELQDSLGALDVSLSPEEVAWLNLQTN